MFEANQNNFNHQRLDVRRLTRFLIPLAFALEACTSTPTPSYLTLINCGFGGGIKKTEVTERNIINGSSYNIDGEATIQRKGDSLVLVNPREVSTVTGDGKSLIYTVDYVNLSLQPMSTARYTATLSLSPNGNDHQDLNIQGACEPPPVK